LNGGERGFALHGEATWNQRPVRGARRAIACLSAASGLLRRRPVFLVVPLALVLMNAVEEAWGVRRIERTSGGYQYLEEKLLLPEPPSTAPVVSQFIASPLAAIGRAFGPSRTLALFSAPLPPVRLTGAHYALEFARQQHVLTDAAAADAMRLPSLASVLVPLLAFPLACLIVAVGLREGRVRIRPLWEAARRSGPTLVAYEAVIVLVRVAVYTPRVRLGGPAFIHHDAGVLAVAAWAVALGSALLCLAPCAIALGGLTALQALRASVTTLVRDWPSSVVLFAMCSLVSGTRVLVALGIIAALQTYAPGRSVGTALLSAMLQHVVFDEMGALVGAWLLVALFLWHADSWGTRQLVPLRHAGC
jgi:hypothetical protein